jgi:hypothetical protein
MAGIAKLHRELNLLLVKMTKNPLFDWNMQTIQIIRGCNHVLLYQDANYREKTIHNWRKTAMAIANREPLKAV